MEVIIKISILMTYLFIIIKGWLLDNQYIIYMVILYKGLSVVWWLTYIQNECKNNKRLVQCIDCLTIESVHVIMKRSKFITYILDEIFVLLIDDQQISDYIIT